MPRPKKHSLRHAAESPDTKAFYKTISAATPDEINASLSRHYADERNTMFMLAAHHHSEAAMKTLAKRASTKAVNKALRQHNHNHQTGLLILTLHQSGAAFQSVIKKSGYSTITTLLREMDNSVGGNQKDTYFSLAAKHQTQTGFRAIIGKSPSLVRELYPTVKRELKYNPDKAKILQDIDFILHTKNTTAKYPQEFLHFMLETLPKNPRRIHEHQEWKTILDTALKSIPDNTENKPIRDQLIAMSCRVAVSALEKNISLDNRVALQPKLITISPASISARDNFLIAGYLNSQEFAELDSKEQLAYRLKALQHLCHAAKAGHAQAIEVLSTEKLDAMIDLHRKLIQLHIDSQSPTYASLFTHTNNVSNYRICKDIIRLPDIDRTMLENAINNTSESHITGDKELVKLLTALKADMDDITKLKLKIHSNQDNIELTQVRSMSR